MPRIDTEYRFIQLHKKEKQIKAGKTWMSPWKCTEIVRISNIDKADIHKGLREIRREKMGFIDWMHNTKRGNADNALRKLLQNWNTGELFV